MNLITNFDTLANLRREAQIGGVGSKAYFAFCGTIFESFPKIYEQAKTANAAIADMRIQLNELTAAEAFQDRVYPWMIECFGEEIARDKEERNHRFLEESLELVQACGCTSGEAHQLVDYVYGRSVGERYQEVGGVMVTLAALCLAQDLDMYENGEAELERIWGRIDQIRAKQASKPKHSPLPQAASEQKGGE